MQYKALNFEIRGEIKSVSFWESKVISEETKITEMEETINKLASEGWRISQMSTNAIIRSNQSMGGGGGSDGYNVFIIMEKE